MGRSLHPHLCLLGLVGLSIAACGDTGLLPIARFDHFPAWLCEGPTPQQVDLDAKSFERFGQAEVLARTGGDDDRVGQNRASRTVPGGVDHALVGDFFDVHRCQQSGTVFAEPVERPPAPGKCHLHRQRLPLLENADLTPPLAEELGELDAHQTAANDGDPLAHRHPASGERADERDVVGETQQPARTDDGAL